MLSLPELVKTHFPQIEPDIVTEKAIIYFFSGYSPDVRDKVVVLEDLVLHSTEAYKEGVNKHSGARWERWATVSSTMYSLKKSRDDRPVLRIYSTAGSKRKGKIRNSTPTSIDKAISNIGLRSRYEDVIKNTIIMLALQRINAIKLGKEKELTTSAKILPRKTLELAYPTAKFFPNMSAEAISSDLATCDSTPWRGNDDVKDYIRRVYGVKAVRKDMIKGLAQLEDPTTLDVLQLFKNLVPVDWVTFMLKEPATYSLTSIGKHERNRYGTRKKLSTSENKFTMKMFFRLLTEQQKKRLFRSQGVISSYILPDTLSLLTKIGHAKLEEELEQLDLTNWEKLHNSLSALHRMLEHTPKPIELNEVAKALHNTEFTVGEDKFLVQAPENTRTLLQWGQQMNNCIASYASEVMSERTNVFGVYEKNTYKIVANIELRKGQVRQFVHNYNRTVDKTMWDAFEKLVEEKEIPDLQVKEENIRPAAQARRVGLEPHPFNNGVQDVHQAAARALQRDELDDLIFDF